MGKKCKFHVFPLFCQRVSACEHFFLKKHKKHDFALETTTEIQKYCEICLEVQKSFVKRNQEVVFFCEKKGKFSYSAPKCEVQKL